MAQPFLPHSDGNGHAVVIGEKAAVTKVAALGTGSAIRLTWTGGPGRIQLGGPTASAADAAHSINLPTEAGIEVFRLGPDHSHIAWDAVDITATMGDGL